MSLLSKNIEVGFCHPSAPMMEINEPKPLQISDVKQPNTLRKDTIFQRCPAVQTYMYNSFRVDYPFSVEFNVNDQQLFSSDPKYLARYEDREPFFSWVGNIFECLCTDVFFFSDTPGVKMLIHPHKDSPLAPVIPAIVDIYKFPRVTHSSVFLSEGQKISIKKGDPAYNVTFFTPNEERVKLVPCSRPDLLNYQKERENYNRLTMAMKWKNLFDDSLRFKPKNQIKKFRLNNK